MSGPLPHNVETERSLLGGLLLSGDLVLDVAQTLTPEDFARPAHGALFAMMLGIRKAGQQVDLVAIVDEAEKRGSIERLGGITYVVSLPNACPSVAGIPGYAERVKDHSIRRRLQLVAQGIIEQVQTGDMETREMLDAAEAAIFKLAQGARPVQDWQGAGPLTDECMRDIEERARRGNTVTGISSGFADIDRITCGWQRADLVVLAARPAMGKTALALNFASAAAKAGTGVGIFSLEMGSLQLIQRMLCAGGPVDAQHARTGALNPDEWPRLSSSADDLAQMPIWVDETSGLTITGLRGKARRLKALDPSLGLIIVDYLQLMQGDNARENREATISGISRGLKVLAKELGIPIIALSQLNRQVESRADKRPMMSDLRESGAIEQDADLVLFIYRDEVYNPESVDRGIAEVGIGKHRAGETGIVRLAFAGRHLRFSNLTRQQDYA